MRLLHLSDLHLSRYGERYDWSPQDDDNEWQPLHTWQRWRIEGRRDKRDRPVRVRLVDPEGVVHLSRKWPSKRDDKIVSQLLSLAMERHFTSSEALITQRPSVEDTASLLRVDGGNTNLRFLHLLDQVLPLDPELIVITGDMTDNGFGYALIEHYLARWIAEKKLLVVPGNHDTYDMMPRKGRRGRANAKLERYRHFAKGLGIEEHACGAYLQFVSDIAIVGLSSCKPPITPLSATGEVSKEQLTWLAEVAKSPDMRQARHRLCLVHHHLLRVPFELGKRSPIEVGLRLRNAPEVMQSCVDAGIDIILHGHRHHGYMIGLPGQPLVVSSPSSTLGCKSTDMRYVWMANLAEKKPFPEFFRLASEVAGETVIHQ